MSQPQQGLLEHSLAIARSSVDAGWSFCLERAEQSQTRCDPLLKPCLRLPALGGGGDSVDLFNRSWPEQESSKTLCLLPS